MSPKNLPLPDEEKIATLCKILQRKLTKEETRRKYAPAKHILTLLGAGAFLTMAMIAPNTIRLGKTFLQNDDWKNWKKYNPFYLRRAIKRLQKEKLVEISEESDQQVIKLTQNGKRKIIKYSLAELEIATPKSWDGKWRIVIYDVTSAKHDLRTSFRETLKSLGFLQLQESVFLIPYPCDKEITFLREYYGVGNEVIYIIAHKLENEDIYRDYFGLV